MRLQKARILYDESCTNYKQVGGLIFSGMEHCHVTKKNSIMEVGRKMLFLTGTGSGRVTCSGTTSNRRCICEHDDLSCCEAKVYAEGILCKDENLIKA